MAPAIRGGREQARPIGLETQRAPFQVPQKSTISSVPDAESPGFLMRIGGRPVPFRLLRRHEPLPVRAIEDHIQFCWHGEGEPLLAVAQINKRDAAIRQGQGHFPSIGADGGGRQTAGPGTQLPAILDITKLDGGVLYRPRGTRRGRDDLPFSVDEFEGTPRVHVSRKIAKDGTRRRVEDTDMAVSPGDGDRVGIGGEGEAGTRELVRQSTRGPSAQDTTISAPLTPASRRPSGPIPNADGSGPWRVDGPFIAVDIQVPDAEGWIGACSRQDAGRLRGRSELGRGCARSRSGAIARWGLPRSEPPHRGCRRPRSGRPCRVRSRRIAAGRPRPRPVLRWPRSR